MLLRHCECYGILLESLKLHVICNLVQEYSHELKDKTHLFDNVNIKIMDEIPDLEVEQVSSVFPNGFYLHWRKSNNIKNRFGVMMIDSGDYLFMSLRFDGYWLQKTPKELSIIFEQNFPLLKTFSLERRLIVYNAMLSNKKRRDCVEEVPESFHLLCNRIQSSILQWYIDKNVTTLFH
jgi:hypothetical protein